MANSKRTDDSIKSDHADTELAPLTRLLVIEDDENDQELLQRKLRQADITDKIQFINSAHKAIELISKDEQLLSTQVFAIFLDLGLKQASGLDVLRVIRSKPKLARLPVIVVTGSDNPDDRKECERLQVSSYLSKPINFQSFCMAIANVFHQPTLAETGK